MVNRLFVLNSDAINRMGSRFTIKGLEDSMEQTVIEGTPSCIGHDMHRIAGWMKPIGLYFEPMLCQMMGTMLISETSEEMKLISDKHKSYLVEKYQKLCTPYIEAFKEHIKDYISDNAAYLYAGCVCCYEKDILKRVYPKLFEKPDKNDLLYLSEILKDFQYLGHGIFKDKHSELAIIAHPYFRKSLSLHNNINHYFFDELMKHADNTMLNLRIALDKDMIGYARTFKKRFEFEYWRGPKFDNDVSQIKSGVTIYQNNDFQKLFHGISKTEFYWKKENDEQTLEVEELKEQPSYGIGNDSYGCRYVHSIFDAKKNTFKHFDGAIRKYTTEGMLARIEKDIKKAGKRSDYTKLFRIDGRLEIDSWKSLVCHFYQGNQLLHEYFGQEVEENQPQAIKDKHENEIEKLVPYSMNEGDGIRLFVSYHPSTETINEERYISSYDSLSINGESIKIIESEIIEVKKVLNRVGSDLKLPDDTILVCCEDLYWNIPTISHPSGSKVEENVHQTITSLEILFEAMVSNGTNKVIAFTLCWDRDDNKQVKISVMGHCTDILEWVKENKKVPVKRELFRDWLEKQSRWLDTHKHNINRPMPSEIIRHDGVLYMERRSISPKIKISDGIDNEITLEFPPEEADVATAVVEGQLFVANGFFLKKATCSYCNKDYESCQHSKYLDRDVSEQVIECSFRSRFWTDRNS